MRLDVLTASALLRRVARRLTREMGSQTLPGRIKLPLCQARLADPGATKSAPCMHSGTSGVPANVVTGYQDRDMRSDLLNVKSSEQILKKSTRPGRSWIRTVPYGRCLMLGWLSANPAIHRYRCSLCGAALGSYWRNLVPGVLLGDLVTICCSVDSDGFERDAWQRTRKS